MFPRFLTLQNSLKNMENRKIKDMFGLELAVGDTVCFTLSMRKDDKPMVKAVIKDIIAGQKENCYGEYTEWLVPEFVESNTVEWARLEGKLISKVKPNRVIKCY